MGAIQLQSAALPRALQREVESLAGEGDGEIQAAGYRSLAARLERRRPELSIAIYGQLAESPTVPEEHRRVARERFAALQGQGSGGARWEALIGRFLPEATDYKMIAPMLLASSVAVVVRAASWSRLSAGSGWFSRGLGLRLGAEGSAFAAELPAFAFSARSLCLLHDDPQAPLLQEFAGTAVTLSLLKSFSGLGQAFAPRLAPSLQPAFATMGLYTAQALEEGWGWRPPNDPAGRLMDSLAAALSLGIGARLGEKFLGEASARWQREIALRRELAFSRSPTKELGFPGLSPALVLMSAENRDAAGNNTALWEQRQAEASKNGYVLNRELGSYRQIFGLTLLGDLVANIEGRLQARAQPVRLLELGPGDGVAARQLKERFGERIRIETSDRYPLPESGHSDFHYLGDFIEAKLEGSYDLILSAFGPHSHHQGRFGPMIQKAAKHLAPGGEFAAALTAGSMRDHEALAWNKLGEFGKAEAAMAQGLLLRLEPATPSRLLYIRRIVDRGEVDWDRILQAPSRSGNPSWQTLNAWSQRLRSQRLQAGGMEWNLDSRVSDQLARNLAALGSEETLNAGPEFPQRLLDRFVEAFRKDHHREPLPREIQDWLDGAAPSALWRKELLIDEWLLLRAAEIGQPTSPSLPPPAAALAVGLGLLLNPSAAWAGPGEALERVSGWLDWRIGVGAALAALSVYGLVRLIKDLRRPQKVDFLPSSKVPWALAMKPPANQQDLARREQPDVVDEAEIVRTGSGSYLIEGLAPDTGWIKAERKRIFEFLNKDRYQEWERDLALRQLRARLLRHLGDDSQIGEAAKLMWDLALAPGVGVEGRQWFKSAYSTFINSPMFFHRGEPPVYRECLRLRRIFSDPQRPLEHRLEAVRAYAGLFRKFDLDQPVARAEVRMARDALADFLDEAQLERGTIPFAVVNGTWLDIDQGVFLWRSAQHNGLKAGNEDWEGND